MPNGKGATNQGPDRVGILLVVNPSFRASTQPLCEKGSPPSMNIKYYDEYFFFVPCMINDEVHSL